jgi:hypothetical protein
MHPQQLRKKASQPISSRLTDRAPRGSPCYLKTRIRGSRLLNAARLLVLIELTHRLHQAYRFVYDKQAADWLLPQNTPQTQTPCEQKLASMFGGENAIMRTRYDYLGNYRGADPELAARVRGNTSQMGTPYFDAEHLFNFPHLSGNLAGTENTDVFVPQGFDRKTVTGPTRGDAVVTIYNATLNVTVAAFHVKNFGVTVTKSGSVRLGTTGGPGGDSSRWDPSKQIYIHILRLGRDALVICHLVINATRQEFRLCQFFVHKALAFRRTDYAVPFRNEDCNCTHLFSSFQRSGSTSNAEAPHGWR